jgi:hypothetical protein
LHRGWQFATLASVQTESLPVPDFSCRGRTWQPLTIALLVVAVAGTGITGCSIEASQKKKLLDRIQPPQPVLTGTAVYGGGSIAVQSWLGPSVRLKKTEPKPGEGEDRGHNGTRRPQSEGSGSAGAAADPFTPGGNNYSSDEIDQLYGRVNYERMSPPRVALTFKFANTGAQTVAFTISDVNSTLGNFAPRPETLTVAPGQTGLLDPMLSNLDANFEELDVSLTLKIGGSRETQILKLRRSQEPTGTPGQN